MQLPEVARARRSGDAPPRYPWWLADSGDSEPCAPLLGVHDTDVVIVGGGYTGLWTALTLKERVPAKHVVVLEAAECGSGASGRNGGSVNGYWSMWAKLPGLVGRGNAEEMARLGSLAQESIRKFCQDSPLDVGFSEDGMAMVATSTAQEAAIDTVLRATADVPAEYRPVDLTSDNLWRLTRNPHIARGLLFPEGACVHPARLVQALKRACLASGVVIHEHSPATDVDVEHAVVTTDAGLLRARDVVLATNAWTSSLTPMNRHVTNLSSHVIVTEPAPDVLSRLEWPAGMLIRDARMFLHWLRVTSDSRIVVGTGAGPLSYRGRVVPAHTHHARSTERVIDVLPKFLPEAAHVGIAAAWGGAIDMSSDNCPFFTTLPGTRVHYGIGYSGHGVNAAWIGGQVLASLTLGTQDRWSRSAFCTRRLPTLPPEPFRYLGGAAVRSRTIALEDAADAGRRAPLHARAIAALPRLFGMRIGIR